MSATNPYLEKWQQIVKIIQEYPRHWMMTNPYASAVIDNTNQDLDIMETYSCFNIPPYIFDLFRLYESQKIENPEKCQPNHIYFFDVYNHIFTILYFSKDDIWYFDYYIETGRSEPLRLEKITLEEFDHMLGVMSTNNIEEIVQFHRGKLARGTSPMLAEELYSELENAVRSGQLKTYIERMQGYKMIRPPQLTNMLDIIFAGQLLVTGKEFGLPEIHTSAFGYKDSNPNALLTYLKYLEMLNQFVKVIIETSHVQR